MTETESPKINWWRKSLSDEARAQYDELLNFFLAFARDNRMKEEIVKESHRQDPNTDWVRLLPKSKGIMVCGPPPHSNGEVDIAWNRFYYRNLCNRIESDLNSRNLSASFRVTPRRDGTTSISYDVYGCECIIRTHE